MLRLADRQLGNVKRVQLLALGYSSRWIDSQIRRGLLIAVRAGVSAVGHVPRHAHCRAMAAVLACGDGAVASHWSDRGALGLNSFPPATLTKWNRVTHLTAVVVTKTGFCVSEIIYG
jgi:hypothetical protein